MVAPSAVAVTGTAVASDGTPVPGAAVSVCPTVGSYGGVCDLTTTDLTGAFTLSELPDATVMLTVYPPATGPDSALATGVAGPFLVPSTGLQGQPIVVPPFGTLQGVSFPSSTELNWSAPTPVALSGCTDGLASVTVTGQDPYTGEFLSSVNILSEDPQGSGTYTGTLAPQYPIHGPVEVEGSVDCPPPPSALVPSLGPASGGNTVILTGAGLTGATGVAFGGTAASEFTVLSDDAIQAVAPPGTGTVPVTVKAGDGSSTTIDQYTYQAVGSVAPASGPAAGGTWVIVTGTGLASATRVRFGDVGAPFYSISDTELEALSPPGQGTVDITVETAYGGTTPPSSADTFTYGAGQTRAAAHPASKSAPHLPAAVVPRLSEAPAAVPLTAAGAQQLGVLRSAVIVSGTGGFGAIAQYLYEEGPKLLSGWDAIQAAIHTGILAGNPTCQTSRQALADSISLAVGDLVDAAVEASLPAAEAVVTFVFSESGPGALVAVALTPAALSYAASALVDKFIAAAVNAALGPCERKSTPPPPVPPPKQPQPGGGGDGGAGAGGSGGAGGSNGFQPNTFIDPSGNVLDTNGNPVTGATATIMRSDTIDGTYTPLDPTQPGIEPAVNPETTAADGVFDWDVYSGFYEVQASAPGCTDAADSSRSAATIGPYPVPPPQVGLTVTLACADEAAAPPPAISSISVDTGPASGGNTVMVLGSGFTPSTQITFGDAAASVTYFGPQALSVVAPPGVGPVDVVAHTAGGASPISTADRFFYGSPPTVTGLGVSTGPAAGGTRVTVSGTGFTGATVVGFGGQPGSSLVVDSDTELQVTAPPAAAGEVDVVVDTPAGGSMPSPADRYTYLPAAPAHNGSGTSGAATVTVTVLPPSSLVPPTPAMKTPAAALKLTRLSETNRRWLEHPMRSRRVEKLPVATTFRFALNEAASVRLQFSDQVRGHMVGGTCRSPGRARDRTHRDCRRTQVDGVLTVNGKPGANSITFNGTLAGHKRLQPGTYTVTFDATSAQGGAATGKLSFVIL
jgi:methionine-rich copper-binding protein CopC